MTVRAKFVVQKVECSHHPKFRNGPDGKPDYKQSYNVEMRTVHMSPVYGNGDPKHENTKFWEASPSGGLTLGTINPEAWQQFSSLAKNTTWISRPLRIQGRNMAIMRAREKIGSPPINSATGFEVFAELYGGVPTPAQ